MPKYLFSSLLIVAYLMNPGCILAGGADKYSSHNSYGGSSSSSTHTSSSTSLYHSSSSTHTSGAATHTYPNIYGSSAHTASGHTGTGHSSYASTISHYGLSGIHHTQNEKGERLDRFGVPYHRSTGSSSASSHKSSTAEDRAKTPDTKPNPIATAPRPAKAKPGQYLPAAPTFLPTYVPQ